MCGRFASFGSEQEVVDTFDVDEVLAYLGPSWNVAPTQTVAMVADAVTDGAAVRQLRTARWGLVASWAKAVAGPPLINARAETLTVKASFRAAARRRRTIVPANGYSGTRADTAASSRPTAPNRLTLSRRPIGRAKIVVASVWRYANHPARKDARLQPSTSFARGCSDA